MYRFLKTASFVLLAGLVGNCPPATAAMSLDLHRQSQTSVILFTAYGCDTCDDALRFLKGRRVAVIECNVSREKSCRKQLDSFDEKTLPRWVYQGKSGTGFSEPQWRWLLFNEFTFGDPAPAYMNNRANGGLMLYTTSVCPICAQARTWLAKNKISYKECNLSTDRACDEDLTRYGDKSVPRWVYRDHTKTGFRESGWRVMFDK